MAKISLGQAALAFAGGAATEYNHQERDRRKREADMEARLRELNEQSALRIAESKFSADYADEVSQNAALRAAGQAGGVNTPAGQYAYYKTMGWAEKEIATILRAGPGNFSGGAGQPTQQSLPQEKPLGYSDLVERSIERMNEVGLGRSAERMRPLMEGAAQSAERDVDDWGKQVAALLPPEKEKLSYHTVNGRLVGMTEDGEMRTMVHFQDTSGNKPTPEMQNYQFYMDQLEIAEGMDEGDPRRARILSAALKGLNIPEDTYGGLHSPEGKQTMDLMRLQGMAANDPDNEQLQNAVTLFEDLIAKNPGITLQKGTTMRDGEAHDSVQAVLLDPEIGAVPIGEAVVLGPQGSAAAGVMMPRELMDVQIKNRGLAEFQFGLQGVFNSKSAAQQGLARTLTNATAYIKENVTGLAELAGVPRETNPDKLRQMYADAGMDMGAVLQELNESNTFLVGMVDQQAGLLVYSLANILKDAGAQKITTEADVRRAIEMVKNVSSSSERGKAAFASTMHYIDIRVATNHQMLYKDSRVPAETRAESGMQLAQLANPSISREQMLTDKEGKVYIFTSNSHRTQFVEEMSRLQERDVNSAMNALPRNLRPTTLDTYITTYGQGGWLFPQRNPAKYLGSFAE